MWRTAGFNTWPTPLSDIYRINDLCNVSKALDFILFADDTNIFFSHKDPIFLMELVNTELQNLSCWFQANKLSINVKKSNYIIFKTSQIFIYKSSFCLNKNSLCTLYYSLVYLYLYYIVLAFGV